MTKWKVAALIAVATVMPALTVLLLLVDLSGTARATVFDTLAGKVWLLAVGLVALVGLIGAIAYRTWRAEQHWDTSTGAAIDVIADVNPAHRLPGDSAVERSVNHLAERHQSAEERLHHQLAAAHEELRTERDALHAVLTGLDVPVGVVDDAGRVLLANPAARRELGAGSRLAAGRSIFAVFDAEDFMPLLARAIDGERPAALVGRWPIRLIRITGPDEPAMVLIMGNPQLDPEDAARAGEQSVGLSLDLARRQRRVPPRSEWRDTPLAELVFTVLDCETTGLHVAAGDRLLSLGAVRVDGANLRADDVFDALVNPGKSIPPSSIEFHGITDDQVADAPAAEAVVADFHHYAAESVLVGHQLSFDLGFLTPPARAAGVDLETLRLDTMLLSAVLDTDPDARHGLDAVCRRFGVEVIGRHTALGDALATAEVLVRMVPLLADRGVVTLGDALAASAATDLGKRLVPQA